MKTHLEKIRQKITSAPHYSVSPELDRKVQGALGWQKMSPTLELESEEVFLSFSWIAPWLARSFRQFVVAAFAIVLMVGGTWFAIQSSYAYHLSRAKIALEDLQSVLSGKPVAQDLWVNQAFAEDSASAAIVSEAQVIDLAQTVVRETEKAIRIVENKTNPAVIERALAEVVAFQDQTVPVLAAAAEAVTTDEATQTVAAALETTATDQAVVVQAQDFVAQAASNGERQVAIDIQTSDDSKPIVAKEEKKDDNRRLEEAKAEYQDARATIEKLRAAGMDEQALANLQEKMGKVVAAFEEGKIGRAHGLSTAVSAQSKHLIRKAGRVEGEKWGKKKIEGQAKSNDPASDSQTTEEPKAADGSWSKPGNSDETRKKDKGAKFEKPKALEDQGFGFRSKDSVEVKWGVVPKVEDHGESAKPARKPSLEGDEAHQQTPEKGIVRPKIPEVEKKGGFEGRGGGKRD
jgi:hypothetical protein